MTTPIVVGIGNPRRGDDRAGIAVARLVRSRLRDHASVVESDGDVGALLEAFGQGRRVILVDASHSGVRPGTVWAPDAIWSASTQIASRTLRMPDSKARPRVSFSDPASNPRVHLTENETRGLYAFRSTTRAVRSSVRRASAV